MGLVEPFYFRSSTQTWHKAIAVTKETRTVLSLCGFTASYDRRNLKYEDTETRPYAAKVCSRCDTDEPVKAVKRGMNAAKVGVQIPQQSFRQGEEFPRLEEENSGGAMVQSDPRPGHGYDDAMRRKPRRILP